MVDLSSDRLYLFNGRSTDALTSAAEETLVNALSPGYAVYHTYIHTHSHTFQNTYIHTYILGPRIRLQHKLAVIAAEYHIGPQTEG
jgi:hypothetical protein